MEKKKNSIFLMTAVTPNYIRRSKAYLHSIRTNSNCAKNFLIVCWDRGKNKIKLKHLIRIMCIKARGGITVKFLNHDKVMHKSKIFCVQHGEFIGVLSPSELAADPAIIFTDSDMRLQRSLNETEETLFRNLNPGEICLGMNVTKEETLGWAALKIGANEELIATFSEEIQNKISFNTGVYVSKARTIRRLLKTYNQDYSSWIKNFTHYAAQQWIINYSIQTDSFFKPLAMPDSFHSHCCRPMRNPNPGTYIDEKKVLREIKTNEPVLFNHKCCELHE